VTTLLSKEQENRQQQAASSVTPEQLKELQQQVSEQGGKVKDAKAVSNIEEDCWAAAAAQQRWDNMPCACSLGWVVVLVYSTALPAPTSPTVHPSLSGLDPCSARHVEVRCQQPGHASMMKGNLQCESVHSGRLMLQHSIAKQVTAAVTCSHSSVTVAACHKHSASVVVLSVIPSPHSGCCC